MQLTVNRKAFTDESTTGELLINGQFFCYTLEPRKDQSQGKPYCIPVGTYLVLLQTSKRFQMLTPHLQNVPGFTEVEIHPGNDAKDTEACLLVGESLAENFVGSSRVCFDALMRTLRAVSGDEAISITYTEPTSSNSNSGEEQ